MSSMLSVRDDRRSRSKSPGGRDRDRSRSRSRDTRDRDRDRSLAARPERRSSKYEESAESASEDGDDYDYDRRRRERKSGKRYDEDEEDDRSRRGGGRKSSKAKYDEDSGEDERHRSNKSSRSSRSQRKDPSPLPSEDDDDRRREKRRDKRNKDVSDDDDRRGSRKEKERPSRRKQAYESDSSDSDVRPPQKSRDRKEAERMLNGGGYAPAPAPPATYGDYPPGYGPPPPAPQANGYQDARHMSYIPGDPRFAPPPGQYLPQPTGPQRPGSFSGGPPSARYEPQGQYQYARPDEVPANYQSDQLRGGDGKQYMKTYNAQGQPQMVEIKPAAGGERERRRPDKDRRYDDDDSDSDDDRREKRDKRYNDDRYEPRGERRNDTRKDDRREDRRGDRRDAREDDRRERRRNDDRRDRADDTGKKLGQLAIGGATGAATLGVAQHAMMGSNGKPPASPLLEAYKGTYQSMSPMPSALVLREHQNDSDLSDFDLQDDSDSDLDPRDPNADLKRKIRKLEKQKEEHARKSGARGAGEKGRDRAKEISPRSSKEDGIEYQTIAPRGRADSNVSDMSAMVISPTSVKKKRVMFYEADEDAKRIAAALEGTHRPPILKPLVQILPPLSDDDIMALRLAYKNHAKVNGQGINIAKHIKMRVTGNLGKACYATALGRWESEAYWANSWYQGGATRRELLIESLMGRSNSDIREVKNCFKDKRYGDDLERCMKAELKADKFRVAILLALEERRMPEQTPLDSRLVMADCKDLYRALASPGGESNMIQIIVVRSDAHLREVLRAFEKAYGVNFARAMIEKSRNLVGETLAHVLNGALNRPMRDALLLHQAIAETAPGKERAELLISRLVRLHWEPKHLEKVKAQYEARYRRSVEAAIKKEVLAGMKTEEGKLWTEFCIELVRSSA